MIVVEPGWEYQIETTDLTAHPTGYQTIKFEKLAGTLLQDGVIDSLEIILMMIDRYTHLATTNPDETDDCVFAYMSAVKAETIVKRYVEENE